ncbi:unnamed protein product [Arabidopsis halleri]
MAGYALQVAEEVDTHEPSTYQEAVSGADAEKWFAAMGDEMESHSKNQTWDLVTRPPGRKIVTCKWIFKIKEGISPVEGVKLKDLLSAEFEMKDLGAAKKILGMEILRDRSQNKLFLSQKGYIQKVLNIFGMLSAKPVDTPFAVNIHLTMFAPQSEEEKEYMSRVPYANAVGSLMYAMVCTRPDLAHAVSIVSRFMGQPGKEHWLAVKRIFRYMRGTSDVGLIYGGEAPSLIAGYSDSDYAGDVDSRRSMTGYVFTLGNSVISWKATLQPTVTLSSTKAEYMALTEAAKEAKNQVHHERTKHIDVRYHFLRNEKRIQVKKVGTADNPADMANRPLMGQQVPEGTFWPLKRHQAPDGASGPSGAFWLLQKHSGLDRRSGFYRSILALTGVLASTEAFWP